MYRPAWRMSHTGVRSTCWPKAQRTRMSRSPVFIPLIFVVASVSVVEWRAGDALINDDGVKAEVLAIALNDVIGVRTFMSQFVYVDDRCLRSRVSRRGMLWRLIKHKCQYDEVWRVWCVVW